MLKHAHANTIMTNWGYVDGADTAVMSHLHGVSFVCLCYSKVPKISVGDHLCVAVYSQVCVSRGI